MVARGDFIYFCCGKKDVLSPETRMEVEGKWEEIVMMEDYVYLLATVTIITFISSFILPIVGNIILSYQHHQ